AQLGGAGECLSRLAGHAKLSARKLGRDVFASLARESQLEVVDRRGAVHGNALNDAALNPVDQVWGTADFDDMSANRRGDCALFPVATDNVVAEIAKLNGSELVGQ